MKNLDNFNTVKSRINHIELDTVMFSHELNEWKNLTDEVRDQKLQRICSLPLCNEDFTIVYSLYTRIKWLDALNMCVPQKDAAILEVGSGSSTNIPNALSVYDTSSKYITANMNKLLTEELRRNTAALPIGIKVIEDDANNILHYLSPESVDAVVFEHSVNDILQAILCERNGIDTINNDWFAILPEMIRIIGAEYTEGTLEQSAKSAFLSLLRNCITVLKPGGYLIMSHYMFQYDLDLGYNAELWENIVPIVRPWLKELPVGNEIQSDLFDPQWWLFYQK